MSSEPGHVCVGQTLCRAKLHQGLNVKGKKNYVEAKEKLGAIKERQSGVSG